MLFRILCTFFLLLMAGFVQYLKAQHVYQIRADSVRIYNVCDTAELILENHTQGVTGYLYNRGAGRTEFRRLELKNLGGTRIAIVGQDTLDLSQMSGIGGIDTIYRAGDSIRYVKKGVVKALYAPVTSGLESVLTAGNQALRNIILGNSTSETQYFYQVNRLVRGTPYTGYMFIGDNGSRTGTSIVSRGAVPEQNKLLILDNGANEPLYSPNNAAQYYRMWHEGNLTLAALGGAPSSGSASYIHNQISTAQAGGQFHITGRGLTNNAFEVRRIGQDVITDGFMLRNPTLSRGANFQLTGATDPGLATWVHSGTDWMKRMEVAADGTISYDRMTVHGFTGERMSQRFNAIGFNRNVWNGGIYDTTRFAYQFTHTASVSPGTDNLALQVYDRQGGIVTNAGLVANGLGYIGINESTPAERLQIGNGEIYVKSNGNTNNAAHKGIKFGTDNDLGFSAIRAWRGSTSNRVGLSFFTTNTAAPIEAMRLDETGKLGIGGVSPSQMLDVNGNILSRGIVLTEKLTSGNSDSRLSIYGGGAKYGGQILLYGGGLNRGFMTFHTGVGDTLQPERMRITNTGRVGIGTPYPSAKLSIGGADLIGEIGRIGFDIDSSQRAYIGAYRHTAIGQGTDLYFGTMGVERLRITNTGRIGIGTDAPSFPIHMSGLNTAGMAIQNTGELSASSGAYFRLYNSGMPSAAGQRLGAVLYGANTTGTTYEAGAQIDAVTEGAWTSASQPTAIVFNTTPLNAKGVQEKMRLSAAGNLTVSGNVTATAFYQTSRRELKTDIQAFDHSALDVFRNAQVRTFRFKADRSREHIGFIADELPGEMAAPGTAGVDQGNTVALLVKAVQELEAKNKALEDKLETLETMIREIKAKQ